MKGLIIHTGLSEITFVPADAIVSIIATKQFDTYRVKYGRGGYTENIGGVSKAELALRDYSDYINICK